jgi:hypothetical protein
LAGVGHHQQRAVYGGEPDVLALVAEVVVDLVGGAELVGAGEQVGDRGTLPRLPLWTGYDAALRRCGEVTRSTIRQRLSITTDGCRWEGINGRP